MSSKEFSPASVRRAMKALGVYKPQFEPIIEIYCQLREQYDALTKAFEESDYRYYETTETGSKKDPIVTTLEALRRDLLAYVAQLGLTAQGLMKLNDAAFVRPKKSALAAALKGVNEK